MRAFQVAADVIMGAILGLFIYVVVQKIWPALEAPATAGVVIAALIGVVLFRRPGGSLASSGRRGKDGR